MIRFLGLLLVAILLAGLNTQEASAYSVKDRIAANQNIKFNWTVDGRVLNRPFSYRWKCEDDGGFNNGVVPGDAFDWRNLRPDKNGKACEFEFFAPRGATDWSQEIISPGGKSQVFSGNVQRNSPWRFEELDQLPQVDTRIPDLAPLNAPDANQTIYTAVNLNLYMTQNPSGFLGGEWAPGQTLSELGLEVVNGQIEGLQGIYWATTPFAFDPDSTGVGFTPEGGDTGLLNSANYGLDIVILQQHESPAVSDAAPPVDDPGDGDGDDDGGGIPLWVWILVVVVVIAIGLFAVLRRRGRSAA